MKLRKEVFRVSIAAFAVTVMAVSSFAADSKTKRRPSKQYTVEQFMTTVTVNGASFSPDEKELLFTSNETGIHNVYVVPVKGGKSTAMTHSTKDSTYAVSFFPKDRRILYTRDQGGNENNHIYVLELDGTERDLTPGDTLKANFGGWAKDKRAFYVTSNERDPKFFDVYRYSAKDYQRRMIFQNDNGMEIGAISPDEAWIALDQPNTTSDSDVFLYNAATRAQKKISDHKGVASYATSEFDPESKHLYFLTNDGSEFMMAKRYDLASGTSEVVERADWDLLYTSLSETGRYRVTGINADASTVIRVHDMKSGKQISLPKIANGDITSVVISPSEKKMAFYLAGDRSPRNLHVLDLTTRKVTRLTDALNREVDADDLVDASIVRFKSFDKMVIPGVLYKPHQATPQAKAPAVLLVHGGPGGQARRGYNSLAQFLANHGYVILDINNRGSSGYGKTFFTADDRKHGAEPLWDCVEAKAYLSTLPYVDKDRIGIMGGSYGGYMVAAALAFKPEVFDVGVDLFGVTNWVRTLQSIPPYWESFRKALYDEIGDPSTELERLKATSPLFHADKIRKPLLVVQGKNDPRVIQPESDEIVEAVKKNGVPVEYLVFDDEGHGFSKRANQIAAYGKIGVFLDTYLKGKKVE